MVRKRKNQPVKRRMFGQKRSCQGGEGALAAVYGIMEWQLESGISRTCCGS